MTAHLIRGNARHLPLMDKSVQAVVCSPPYFGLRSYSTEPQIWGGDPACSHQLEDGPVVKPMTGGTGAASKKQVTNAGSQFGNAWADIKTPVNNRHAMAIAAGLEGGNGVGGSANSRVWSRTSQTCTLCGAWAGELGSEPNVSMFVSHLVEVFRECRRVMRDDAVLFCNIGDGYGGSGKGPTGKNGLGNQERRQGFKNQSSSGRSKSLALVPERLAIALADDGWVIRSRICWAKKSPMPESVTDRPTSAWEHIWMITKGPKYFWDAEAVRQDDAGYTSGNGFAGRQGGSRDLPMSGGSGSDRQCKPGEGANLRNFWLLSPDPYPGQHFATYPRELVRRCVAAATSEYGACGACGAPWRRTTETEYRRHEKWFGDKQAARHSRGSAGQSYNEPIATRTTGWATTCKCGSSAGVRPCIVADVFSGSGTTAFVAASMGRVGIGVELSAEYIRQAQAGRLAQGFLPLAPPSPIQPRSLFDEVPA